MTCLIGWLALICLLHGCAAPYDGRDPFAVRDAAVAQQQAAVANSPPAGFQQPPMQTASPAAARSNAESLAEVVAEFATLDPAAQTRLINDLRQTDPALWPYLLQSFRAALAYQQQAQGQRPPGELHPRELHPGDAAPSTARVSSGAPNTLALTPNAFNPNTGPPNTAPPGDETYRFANSTPPTPDEIDRGSPAGHGALASAFSPAMDRAPDQRDPFDADRIVRPASFERDASSSYDAAIRDLEERVRAAPSGAERIDQEIRLRMLYLSAGRRDDALRRIEGAAPEEQEFWAAELYGLAAWLDAERMPAADRRAAEALVHLEQARAKLAMQSTLDVRNLNFCTDVESYGVFKGFDKYEFRSGQELLLYAEIDHFKSEPSREGFHTVLRSHYQIFDRRGQRIVEQEFPSMEEHCRNHRHDFFVSYWLKLPETIHEGDYSLQLTIEDAIGNKVGQSSIDFSIKPSS